MRYSLIDANNLVENVIIWNGGESLWPNLLPIKLDPDERCDIGWTYDPSASPRFIEPSEV